MSHDIFSPNTKKAFSARCQLSPNHQEIISAESLPDLSRFITSTKQRGSPANIWPLIAYFATAPTVQLFNCPNRTMTPSRQFQRVGYLYPASQEPNQSKPSDSPEPTCTVWSLPLTSQQSRLHMEVCLTLCQRVGENNHRFLKVC